MIIYLYGPDSYRRTKKLSEITSAFTAKHPEGQLTRFSFDEKDSVFKFSAFLGSQSLFASAKLAILEDLIEAPADVVDLIKEEKETKGTTLVIVSEKKLGSPFTFLSKKPILFQSFEDLDVAELAIFAKGEADAQGLKISSEDIQALATVFKGDTWGLVTELEQVALGGDVKKKLATPAFFSLIQSLKSSDLRTRLGAASRLIEQEEPAAAFNVSASIAGPGLKKKMADYDILVKAGKLDYEEAILDLALTS